MQSHKLMHFTLVAMALALIGGSPVTATCLPEAVPSNLMDTSKPIRVLVASWDSSALLAHVFSILVEERLGVRTTFIDRDAVFEKLASNWTSTATLMAMDAADIDLDNWDTLFEVNHTSELYPMVGSGINGYLAREGWYMPKYLVDMSPDLQSYISLKEPRLARIFGTNPPANISSAIQLLNPSAARDAALASSACQAAAAAANISACIDTLFSSVLGTRSGRGKIHVANFTFWNTYDRHILRGLGLQLDKVEINPPIEANLLLSLQTAYNRRNPWIGYLWEPHAIFSNYSGMEMIRVSLPLWTTECHAKLNEDPPTMPCDYPTVFTRKVWRKQLADEQPFVKSLAEALRVNNEYILEMLGEITYRGATPRQAACHWLLAHRSWWEPMVPSVQLRRPECPPGTEAAKIEPSSRYWTCARCPRGFFNLFSNSTCQPCPSGGQCPGGSTFLVQRNWYYLPDSEVTNSGIPRLYACDVRSQCCPSGSCELHNVCPSGLSGNFCAECATAGQVKWDFVRHCNNFITSR
ncbi:hypothetical protein BCR44DRAFT_1488597 [Catenaria anguillulae PL171]|uniref:ABC-type glycine betaine transport system substrate-binding domain-containing protein n=1 Tax=Catenaria anguillulae PL171 TaxID=765915 RepID=A0A1Y2H776_9FUNG|nr:hypothetical protein BCR44DRAFT_1488597 [Catenaria anguillulae PL171]